MCDHEERIALQFDGDITALQCEVIPLARVGTAVHDVGAWQQQVHGGACHETHHAADGGWWK